MNEYNDEISLRDLYLILRRGLWLIIGVAVLAGVASFVITSLRPAVYEASATVLVAPIPARLQDTAGRNFMQQTDVNFETYEAVALSLPVLQELLDRGGLIDTSVNQLRKRVEVALLVGPQRSEESRQLIMSHTVTSADAAEAAELTNLWASLTIDSVQDVMFAILDPISGNAQAELAELIGEITGLELAWEEFQNRDNRTLLEAQLSSLARRSAESRESLDRLDRDIAAGQASMMTLTDTLRESQAGSTVRPGDGSESALALLSARSLLSDEAGAELSAFLQDSTTNTELVRLVLGLELQQQAGGLVALGAQRDTTSAQQTEYEAQAAQLRTQISQLTREHTERERELRLVSEQYEQAVKLTPVLDYTHRMIPSSSSVLQEAGTPAEPEPRSRMLVTVIAALVAGLLALVFVFLREAVRPEPQPVGAVGAAASGS